MERETRNTSVSPSEKTVPIDREKTLASPRFDDKSIQRARPAVPIRRGAGAGRFGSSMVLVACIVAGLIGGVAGGLALALYQKRSADESQPAAVVVGKQPSSTAPTASPSSSPAAAATAPAVTPNNEATPAPPAPSSSSSEDAQPGDDSREADGKEEAELRGALQEWVAATNARDIGRQMSFYGETVGAFYRTRNVPREAVRAEKTRVFGRADTIEISAAAPAVSLSRDGQTATMRFRKKYNIEGGGQERRGEVLQELRWRRTKDGWKIVSERDLRVID